MYGVPMTRDSTERLPPEQASLGHAADVGLGALQGRRRGRRLEQREQPLVGGRGQAAELGEHRPVDADPAVGGEPQVQRGDVGEADQRLARPGGRGLPAGAPAAASRRSRRARRTPP